MRHILDHCERGGEEIIFAPPELRRPVVAARGLAPIDQEQGMGR